MLQWLDDKHLVQHLRLKVVNNTNLALSLFPIKRTALTVNEKYKGHVKTCRMTKPLDAHCSKWMVPQITRKHNKQKQVKEHQSSIL